MSYRYEVETIAGLRSNLVADYNDRVVKRINEENECIINCYSMSESARSYVKNGSKIYAYNEDNEIEYIGIITNYSTMEAGSMSITSKGYIDFVLSKDYGEYVNSPYVNVASKTIIEDIINESGFGIGLVEDGINLTIRINNTESYLSALNKIIDKTGQEIYFNYVENKIYVVNHKGSVNSVITLNDKKDIDNMKNNPNLHPANVVKVYGAGDGAYQVKATASDVAVGDIKMVKIVTDRSLKSNDECQLIANSILAKEKQNVSLINFDVLNPYIKFELGDVITINAPEKDINNIEYRIVEIEKGSKLGSDYIKLVVTNKEYSQVIRSSNKNINRINENIITSNTYSQGSGNTQNYEGMINCNSVYPLRIGVYIPEGSLIDYNGNNNLKRFSVSYEVDKYRSSVGTSSADDAGTDITALNDANNSGVSINEDPSDIVADKNSVSSSILEIVGNNSYSSYLSVNIPNITGEIDWVNVSYTIEFLTGADSGLVDVMIYDVVYSGSDFNLLLMQNQFVYRPEGRNFLTDAWLASTGDPPVYYVDWDNEREMRNPTTKSYNVVNSNVLKRDSIRARIYNTMGESVSICQTLIVSWVKKHSHDLDYIDPNHNHDLNITDPEHTHSITIGTGSGDASSINATEISSIGLYYWDGSVWILKNEVVNTGKILDYGVDISDGGNYPDAEGYWKVEVKTNNSSPDLVKCIVNLEHNLN